MRKWVVFIALLALGVCAGAEDELVREQAGKLLKIESVLRGTSGDAVVSGTAAYPDGVVVVATIEFAGARGPFARGPVEKGRFKIAFEPPAGKVIAGPYTYRVETLERDQVWEIVRTIAAGFAPDAAFVTLTVGSREDAEHDLALVREKIGAAVDGMRRLFRQLTERGSFVFSAMNAAQKKNDGAIPDAVRDKLLGEWDRYGSEYWEEALRVVQMDYRQYRGAVFLSPFPDADADVQQTITFLERLYGAYWGEISRYLKVELPERIAACPFTRPQLQGQLQAVAERIYEKVGLPRNDWALIDLAQEEQGTVDGDTYSSKTAKFRITKPTDWKFDSTGTGATTRLRLVPPGGGADPSPVVAAVEVKDYPEAENFRDLARMTELFNFERWPGFKKLTSRDLRAPDPSMPDGVRPGFAMLLLTENKRRTYKIDDYELFCRWHKRTYGVLCIAPPELYKKYEKEFAAIEESFMVLDAPEEPKKD